jgi:hypothetical protein
MVTMKLQLVYLLIFLPAILRHTINHYRKLCATVHLHVLYKKRQYDLAYMRLQLVQISFLLPNPLRATIYYHPIFYATVCGQLLQKTRPDDSVPMILQLVHLAIFLQDPPSHHSIYHLLTIYATGRYQNLYEKCRHDLVQIRNLLDQSC